jgi:glycosyltransferase involved in cell wall biosynthesis
MRRQLRRISIDLTPVLPGGDNGGAKLLARSLVHELSQLAPEIQFVLLTSSVSHAELADLDSGNVRRQCVDEDLAPSTIDQSPLGGPRLAARLVVNTVVPPSARMRVKDSVWTFVKRHRRESVAGNSDVDLHFCPFTAPFFFDARVPLVSVIHDLQFLDHPEFFDEVRGGERRQHFMDACARANLLICVSDFVRASVMRHASVDPAVVRTVYSAVLHASAVEPAARSAAVRVLHERGLQRQRYLLYPANAWPHKNHQRLIQAFGLFLKQHPESDLGLVCSGAPSAAFDTLETLCRELLPEGSFSFPGYLPEAEFAAVLQACRALAFPSLYEGFGLPILEAMACARPVLCSSAASLPEIAGNAALLFDPRDTTAMARAIDRLEFEPGLESALVQAGRERSAQFGSAQDMAARYLAVFKEVRAQPGSPGLAESKW